MKGKTIWLSPETKERLDNIREKRETFNQAVAKLLYVWDTLNRIVSTLEPGHPVREQLKIKEEVKVND